MVGGLRECPKLLMGTLNLGRNFLAICNFILFGGDPPIWAGDNWVKGTHMTVKMCVKRWFIFHTVYMLRFLNTLQYITLVPGD